MKKLILFLIIALFTISCKKEPGTVSGIATYYFNDYQGYKPDLGAKVYLTTDSCDTINEYLSVCKAKDIIEQSENSLESFKSLGKKENKDMIDEINNLLLEERKEVSKYAKDSIEFKVKENNAFRSLHRILSNKDIYNTTVDANGNYSIDVPPGNYNVISISSGRTRLNLLEINGEVVLKRVIVKSKSKSNVDIKFDL